MSVNRNNRKWFLMLCELHYPGIHGKTIDSDPNIENHYLVYDRFHGKTGVSFQELDEYTEYNTDDDSSDDEDPEFNNVIKIDNSIELLQNFYSNNHNIDPAILGQHPTIRNYHNIISRPDYIKAEIGEYIILPTQESVAILKTFWFRIIQRAWKKAFQQRKIIIRNRSNPGSIYLREVNGIWPENCMGLPSLKGILSNLKM
jgi:hypothetical protein